MDFYLTTTASTFTQISQSRLLLTVVIMLYDNSYKTYFSSDTNLHR